MKPRIRKVIVPYPVLKKGDLLKNLKLFAEAKKDTLKNIVKIYICDKLGELDNEKNSILTSRKKIIKIRKCINIGRSILKSSRKMKKK
ncbi:MAG: hypothetical protein NG737_07845 [Omnitrophica bacterium]|nr:hypothetical protein [Candidatus Omnitrophota bacterium]